MSKKVYLRTHHLLYRRLQRQVHPDKNRLTDDALLAEAVNKVLQAGR